jgi:hypothetical protein
MLFTAILLVKLILLRNWSVLQRLHKSLYTSPYFESVEHTVHNIIFHHPVALYRSAFWSFCAVYGQRRSLVFPRIRGWPVRPKHVASNKGI